MEVETAAPTEASAKYNSAASITRRRPRRSPIRPAIGCSEAKGWELAWQVHNTGKAVVKVGAETECVRVGNVLASIGLIVTVVQS